MIARAARHDLAAFAALVRLHEADLRRFARRLAGDLGDDLAQDTFLTAWTKLAQWRGEGSFAGWLKKIATRRFLDDRRSAMARADREADVQAPAAGNPQQRVEIDQALSSLPPRERASCLLIYAYGHTHVEAAEMLGMPLGTLKTLVGRGRAQLIETLEGDGG